MEDNTKQKESECGRRRNRRHASQPGSELRVSRVSVAFVPARRRQFSSYTVNQSSGFNIYEGEILIKCHHKWWSMDCNSDNGMQTESASQVINHKQPHHSPPGWRSGAGGVGGGGIGGTASLLVQSPAFIPAQPILLLLRCRPFFGSKRQYEVGKKLAFHFRIQQSDLPLQYVEILAGWLAGWLVSVSCGGVPGPIFTKASCRGAAVDGKAQGLETLARGGATRKKYNSIKFYVK